MTEPRKAEKATWEGLTAAKLRGEGCSAWVRARGSLKTANDAGDAGRMLADVKTALAAAEKERAAELRPHLDAEKKVRDAWRPCVEALQRAAGDLSDALRAYQRRIEEEERLAREKLAAAQLRAQQTGRPVRLTPEMVPPPSMSQTVQGLQPRKVWRWRVTDFSRVPREFLRIDEAKVTEHQRAQRPAPDGIEYYEDTTYAREQGS